MAIKKFKNIIVDSDKKTFTVEKGSVGEYYYQDVVYAKIVYEEDRYKGKTEMFSHIINAHTMVTSLFFHGDVWCGVQLEMKDGNVVYAYISNCASQHNSLQFHEDTRCAQAFLTFLRSKRVLFKNIHFNTNTKTFSVYKGDVGTYPYTEIARCIVEIEYENRYAPISEYAMIHLADKVNKARVKLVFTMKNGKEIQAYISDTMLTEKTVLFLNDEIIANDVKKLVRKMIRKYKEKEEMKTK